MDWDSTIIKCALISLAFVMKSVHELVLLFSCLNKFTGSVIA